MVMAGYIGGTRSQAETEAFAPVPAHARVDSLRRGAIAILAGCCWIAALTIGAMGLSLGSEVAVAAVIAGALAAFATWAAVTRRSDDRVRLGIGMVAALLPLLLQFAMIGAGGQVEPQFDLHFAIFLALALLVPLCDPRAIVVACTLAIAGQATLGLASLAWTLVHAAELAVAGVILHAATTGITRTFGKIARLEQDVADQKEQIAQGIDALRAARAEAAAERENSARQHAATIAEHKAARDAIAAEFERTISAVTRSVAGTAHMLEESAQQLKSLADLAGEETRGVVGSAVSASKAANTVAAGVAELSLSIAEVAAHVSQQSELTSVATERSGGGGTAIGSLSKQSKTIGETTRAIVRIAERTNLLSLNAAIEAASAGPAGRGFNIVAYEVKVLADQATKAATEIETFLKGVRSGTLEAERSFEAIDAAIAELGRAAIRIRSDVENQRQSADTIESFARNSARNTDAMVQQVRGLADRAIAAADLSDELDRAAAALADHARNLELSAKSFTARLAAA